MDAAQEKGECPQRLENFEALDAPGRKAALDSLEASAKARIYSLAAQANTKDCKHFTLAGTHRDLNEIDHRAEADEEENGVLLTREPGRSASARVRLLRKRESHPNVLS